MSKKHLFDRGKMKYYPLSERFNKINILELLEEQSVLPTISLELDEKLTKIAKNILTAREQDSAVICAYGAHSIKNGLGPLLGKFLQHDWITHLATNGAGIIHDWEIAYFGKTSEDVRTNVKQGRFGTWEETGKVINLALACGAFREMGYGESIGNCLLNGGIDVPSKKELEDYILTSLATRDNKTNQKIGAAADLLELIESSNIKEGFLPIEHPYRELSVQYLAQINKKRSTSHPMFGHDIIYTHVTNRGSVIGRTAEVDFLSFVDSVSRLKGGVYLSIGSAVMSPMIFEKALSMARNVSLQKGEPLSDIKIHVVDLMTSTWDWSLGEPPDTDPAYYLRFMKTFSRMGCYSDYLQCDNRLFLQGLYQKLNELSRKP